MARRIFVSYNFKDREIAHNIGKFFQSEGGKCQGKPVFVKNDLSKQGKKSIDKEIQSVIAGCSAVLFIIGDNNHNSPWINREAELSISMGLKSVAIRYPDTTGSLPNVLKKCEIPFVEWDQSSLSNILNRF